MHDPGLQGRSRGRDRAPAEAIRRRPARGRGDRRGPHPAPDPRRGRRDPAHQRLLARPPTRRWPSSSNSARVPGLPAPLPWREIWVYSPRVEGIHLRGGPVARGGLRWSDRRDDFRTEILGLMKAQLVKNAVIVPTGAKGGFYPKQLPARRRTATPGWRKAPKATASSSAPCCRSPTISSTARSSIPTRVVRPRRRRSLFRRRRRQGHGDLLRRRQRDRARARLLARRRLRQRRHQRLRPQGDGHHRQGRLGLGPAPLPRDGHRRPDPADPGRRLRRHVGRRVRQRHAAVARRSSWSRPSTTATSSSIPIPIRRRAGTSASGCSTCRARAGTITTAQLMSKGGDDLPAQPEVDPADARGARGARHRRPRRSTRRR